MISLDNKLLVSLKYLFFRPGKLTVEYMNGRVVSYVHPSKLFWFSSLIFFFVLIGWANFDDDTPADARQEVAAMVESEKQADPAYVQRQQEQSVASEEEELAELKQSAEQFEKSPKPWKNFKEFMKSGGGQAVRDAFSKKAPYAMFLLVPFFALLIFLFFYRRGRFYVDSVIFSLHFHTFTFLFLATFLLASQIQGVAVHIQWTLWAIPAYLLVSLWRVYRPRVWGLIWKPFFIWLIYLTVILAVALILLILVAYWDHSIFASG